MMKQIRKKRAMASAQEPGRQFAALPYRDRHGLEILLLTSRDTRRWVIPKGWPMKGLPPHGAAACEAIEEAGVVGRVSKKPIGKFEYVKRLTDGAPLQCSVDVFSLKVAKQLAVWPEREERTAHWFAPEEASELVDEPDLRALILAFKDAHARAAEKKKKAKAAKAAANGDTPARPVAA
jgi:8-oxo-dGTP pyrophosphatase MutT (NUDIX family)